MEANVGVTCIYLGNLSQNCSKRDIYELFRSYGRIIDIHIQKQKRQIDGRVTYGFVNFGSTASAASAIKALNNFPFFGHNLEINWAVETPREHSDSQYINNETSLGNVNGTSQVHVSFISDQANYLVNHEVLKDVFSVYGDVIEVTIIKNKVIPAIEKGKAARQSGHGFIHFLHNEVGIAAATAAVSCLHQQTIQQITYNCAYSKYIKRGGEHAAQIHLANNRSKELSLPPVAEGNETPALTTDPHEKMSPAGKNTVGKTSTTSASGHNEGAPVNERDNIEGKYSGEENTGSHGQEPTTPQSRNSNASTPRHGLQYHHQKYLNHNRSQPANAAPPTTPASLPVGAVHNPPPATAPASLYSVINEQMVDPQQLALFSVVYNQALQQERNLGGNVTNSNNNSFPMAPSLYPLQMQQSYPVPYSPSPGFLTTSPVLQNAYVPPPFLLPPTAGHPNRPSLMRISSDQSLSPSPSPVERYGSFVRVSSSGSNDGSGTISNISSNSYYQPSPPLQYNRNLQLSPSPPQYLQQQLQTSNSVPQYSQMQPPNFVSHSQLQHHRPQQGQQPPQPQQRQFARLAQQELAMMAGAQIEQRHHQQQQQQQQQVPQVQPSSKPGIHHHKNKYYRNGSGDHNQPQQGNPDDSNNLGPSNNR